MADDFGERTEPPTPRRRQEARDKGQVARSQELPAAVVLLAGMIALDTLGAGLWGTLLSVMRGALSATQPLQQGELAGFAGSAALAVAKAMSPLLVVLFLAALVTVYWEVGLLLTLTPLTPSLNKLNPLAGLHRICSFRTAVAAAINLWKLAVMVAAAWWTVSGAVQQIRHSLNLDHVELYVMAAGLLIRVGVRLAIALLIIALVDYAYQRYRFERDLRMSKEEIKEELRRMEGDPLMKRRRREVQMKLAYQRIRRDVPKADVVVTNPTHLAIALRYDPDTMGAPKVVAKGADWLAMRIREIAAANGVPVVERRELARLMYDAVEVGQEIPERFYQAVAEILAYVYELTGRNLRPQPVPAAG